MMVFCCIHIFVVCLLTMNTSDHFVKQTWWPSWTLVSHFSPFSVKSLNYCHWCWSSILFSELLFDSPILQLTESLFTRYNFVFFPQSIVFISGVLGCLFYERFIGETIWQTCVVQSQYYWHNKYEQLGCKAKYLVMKKEQR